MDKFMNDEFVQTLQLMLEELRQIKYFIREQRDFMAAASQRPRSNVIQGKWPQRDGDKLVPHEPIHGHDP